MRIPTKDHEVLKNFQVTFRVTSTAAPSVVINPEGVAVYSQLRLVIVVAVTIPTSSRTTSLCFLSGHFVVNDNFFNYL